MAINVYASHVFVRAEPFDPDTVLKLIDANPRPLLISGWSLAVEDSVTENCPLAIGYGDGTTLAGTVMPFDKAAADQFRNWKFVGGSLYVPADAGLALVGGATGATVTGTIFVRLR